MLRENTPSEVLHKQCAENYGEVEEQDLFSEPYILKCGQNECYLLTLEK